MEEITILKNFHDTEKYIHEVQAIADKHRNEFGFLVASAYSELCVKDRIWIAVDDDGQLQGYLIFGGIYPTLKIFQLLVLPAAKKTGLGKKLIASLKDFGESYGYLSITAKVAADLTANQFWEKAGLLISKQIAGGVTTKRKINCRVLILNSPDLIGHVEKEKQSVLKYSLAPVYDAPVYAIDLNPIFDITKNRLHSVEAKVVFELGYNHQIQLCKTSEFEVELVRTSHNTEEDSLLKIISTLPTLESCPPEESKKLTSGLRAIIFPQRKTNSTKAANDQSDLNHLAHCIWNHIDGFITREKAMLKQSDEIFKKYRIQIISPQEIIGDSSHEGLSSISVEQGEDINMSALHAQHIGSLTTFLYTIYPTIGEAKALAISGLKDPSVHNFVAHTSGNICCWVRWNTPTKISPKIDFRLIVDETAKGIDSLIHHSIETVLRQALTAGITSVTLDCGPHSIKVKEVAKKRGFLSNSERTLDKVCIKGYLDYQNWPVFCGGFTNLTPYKLPKDIPTIAEATNTGICINDKSGHLKNTLPLFEFETLISPSFLLLKDRECLILPIKEKYATELIGNVTYQLSLIPTPEVSLTLEKAYFRSPTRASYFETGRIIAFYVSGSKSIQEIIGFARVTYSAILPLKEVFLKYNQQGVLKKNELEQYVNKRGEIHIFTFDNFQESKHRISFKKAKELGLISDANLTTVEKLSYNQFKILAKESF